MTERNIDPPGMAPAAEYTALSAGAQLQLAREDAGLTLEAVAQQLKLAPRQVQAIENDDFAGLPGRTFVRGFVRNYARLLHLDGDAIVAALPGGSASALDSPALHPTTQTIGELPASERGKASWTRWAIPLTLVAIIGAAAMYEFSRSREGRLAPSLRGNDAAPATTADAASSTAASTTSPTAASPTATPGGGQTLQNPFNARDSSGVADNAPAANPAGSTAAGGTSSTTSAPGTQAGDGAIATVLLTFRDASWTTVRDHSGNVLLSQLMAAGQTQTFSGTPPFELVIGNAAKVSLNYRGAPIDLAPYMKSGVARLTLLP